MMISLLIANLDSVLVVVLFILAMVYMVKKGATKQVNGMLFYLVSEAEREFGSGTGALKYSAVTTWLYERLPVIIKLLFTDKQIDKMIENAVTDMKEYLGKNINAFNIIVE